MRAAAPQAPQTAPGPKAAAVAQGGAGGAMPPVCSGPGMGWGGVTSISMFISIFILILISVLIKVLKANQGT